MTRTCVSLRREKCESKMCVMIQKSIFVFTRPKTDSHLRLLKEREVRVKTCVMIQISIFVKGTTITFLAKNKRLSGSRIFGTVWPSDFGSVPSSAVFASIADKLDRHLQLHHESVSRNWPLVHVRLRQGRQLRPSNSRAARRNCHCLRPLLFANRIAG